jgi:raffinose/stachyose/melibiose transport system substrate-binding protein
LKKNMSHKIVAILICMVMTASLFAGCGTKTAEKQTGSEVTTEPAQTTEPAKTADVKKDVTISVAASQGWIKDVDKTLAESFTNESGIKVDLQVNPDDQYQSVIKAKLAAGAGPDIFYFGVSDMAKFFPDKYMADLSSESWVNDYSDWAKTASSNAGKVVALNTWGRDGWGMLYDSEMFQKNGWSVPNSYDEFLKLCASIKSIGITPVWQPGKEDWHMGQWFLEAASGLAEKTDGLADKLNKNETKFADNKDFEKILARFKEIKDKGYLNEDFMSSGWSSSEDKMASGKFAMLMVWSAEGATINQKYPDSGSADKWKLFPVPLADNMKLWPMSNGGVERAMYKDSANADAVKTYFTFLTKPENLKTYYDGRTDLCETSFKTVEGKPTAAFKSAIEYAVDGTVQELGNTVQYFDTSIVGKAIQEMMVGGKTPKQVLEAIDSGRQKMFDANK